MKTARPRKGITHVSERIVEIGGKIFRLRHHFGELTFEHYYFDSNGQRRGALFADDDLVRMQKYRETAFEVRRTGGCDKATSAKLRSFAKMDIRDIEGKRVDLLTDPKTVVQKWAAKTKYQLAAYKEARQLEYREPYVNHLGRKTNRQRNEEA
jgi:hypothetical protein